MEHGHWSLSIPPEYIRKPDWVNSAELGISCLF